MQTWLGGAEEHLQQNCQIKDYQKTRTGCEYVGYAYCILQRKAKLGRTNLRLGRGLDIAASGFSQISICCFLAGVFQNLPLERTGSHHDYNEIGVSLAMEPAAREIQIEESLGQESKGQENPSNASKSDKQDRRVFVKTYEEASARPARRARYETQSKKDKDGYLKPKQQRSPTYLDFDREATNLWAEPKIKNCAFLVTKLWFAKLYRTLNWKVDAQKSLCRVVGSCIFKCTLRLIILSSCFVALSSKVATRLNLLFPHIIFLHIFCSAAHKRLQFLENPNKSL